jgi:predicted porin
VLSWEASKTLWSCNEAGRLDIDWSVSGGVLFGKQKMNGAGEEIGTSYSAGIIYFDDFTVLGGPDTTTIEIDPRSKSVTAPTLGASLGLSYSAGPMRIGAGYRWERYNDAIDGGFTEHKSYDRTLDGPYFKVSVGFGG